MKRYQSCLKRRVNQTENFDSSNFVERFFLYFLAKKQTNKQKTSNFFSLIIHTEFQELHSWLYIFIFLCFSQLHLLELNLFQFEFIAVHRQIKLIDLDFILSIRATKPLNTTNYQRTFTIFEIYYCFFSGRVIFVHSFSNWHSLIFFFQLTTKLNYSFVITCTNLQQ